ncbi:MAG: hypothetical protein ACLRWA_06525 [Lachnospira sp.]
MLDFIGNYKIHLLIPIALSGDRSYNKDNVRRYVVEGARIIRGSSTFILMRFHRNVYLVAIDNANFSDIKLIQGKLSELKNKLGRIPALVDFDRYGGNGCTTHF